VKRPKVPKSAVSLMLRCPSVVPKFANQVTVGKPTATYPRMIIHVF